MKKQEAIKNSQSNKDTHVQNSIMSLFGENSDAGMSEISDRDTRINRLIQQHIRLQYEAAKELGKYYTVTDSEAKTVSIYQNDKLIETVAYEVLNNE